MNKTARIAIVGAGMVGIQLLREYIRQDGQKVDLYIFDRPDRAGYGGPFAPDHSSLLLNQPQSEMSLRGSEKDYIQWLERNLPEQAHRRFTSRMDFGKYSHTCFEELISSPQVHFIPAIIEEVLPFGSRWKIRDATGRNRIFDGVHLACGPVAYQDPYQLKGQKGFIGTPYPLSKTWQQIKNAPSIGILGSGLATVDVLVFLHAHDFKGSITCLSLDGLFPTVRGSDSTWRMPHLDALLAGGRGNLAELIEAICKDARLHRFPLRKFLPDPEQPPVDTISFQLDHPRQMGQAQHLISSRNAEYAAYWNQLPRKDQIEFQEKYRELYLLLQSPMPPESAEKILAGLRSGQVRVLTDVEDVTSGKKGLEVLHSSDSLHLDYLINTTGIGQALDRMAFENDASRLLTRLTNQGLLQEDPNGGALILYPEHSVVSQRHGTLHTLKLHGAMTAGTVFGNNSINLLGKGAALACRHMLTTLTQAG